MSEDSVVPLELILTPDKKKLERLPALSSYDRLTSILTVNYEHRGFNPTSAGPIISSGMLETLGEEPFKRSIKLGEDWVDLFEHAKCWMSLDKVGYFVLENWAGKSNNVNPTKAESDALKSCILEVGYNPDDVWLTPPKFPFYGYPKQAERIIARCQLGVADCYLSVFPK